MGLFSTRDVGQILVSLLLFAACLFVPRTYLAMFVLVAVGSSGILKGKPKLGVTFNSDKLG